MRSVVISLLLCGLFILPAAAPAQAASKVPVPSADVPAHAALAPGAARTRWLDHVPTPAAEAATAQARTGPSPRAQPAGPMAASAAAPAAASQPAPARLAVALDAVPAGLALGDRYLGGTVAALDRTAGLVTVATGDLAASRRAADADHAVRFTESDRRQALATDAALTPDDPLYPLQYGPAMVGAPDAWATGAPDGTSSVCVVDTGVDAAHEDLAARWRGGYDFVNLDDDPQDDMGHGTHVGASPPPRQATASASPVSLAPPAREASTCTPPRCSTPGATATSPTSPWASGGVPTTCRPPPSST